MSEQRTYGQIAYEAGAAHLVKLGVDLVDDTTFAPWAALDDNDKAYWDEVGRAVSVATYEHHANADPLPEGWR